MIKGSGGKSVDGIAGEDSGASGSRAAVGAVTGIYSVFYISIGGIDSTGGDDISGESGLSGSDAGGRSGGGNGGSGGCNCIIGETPHREAIRLIIVEAVDRGVAGIQVATPRVQSPISRRRPKVRARRAIAEAAVSTAEAGQQSVETGTATGFKFGSGIRAVPSTTGS